MAQRQVAQLFFADSNERTKWMELMNEMKLMEFVLWVHAAEEEEEEPAANQAAPLRGKPTTQPIKCWPFSLGRIWWLCWRSSFPFLLSSLLSFSSFLSFSFWRQGGPTKEKKEDKLMKRTSGLWLGAQPSAAENNPINLIFFNWLSFLFAFLLSLKKKEVCFVVCVWLMRLVGELINCLY